MSEAAAMDRLKPVKGRKALRVLLVLAALVAAYALVVAVSGYPPPQLRPSFALRAAAFRVHIVGGAVALVIGALQLRPASRGRHRWLGRLYVASVAAGMGAALLLTPFTDQGMTTHLGFGALAVAWGATTGLAFLRARQRQFARHREWIIRSYALTCAGITLRIWLPLLMLFSRGDWPFTYQLVAWLCWVPNLVAAELWLRRSAAARESQAAELG
ncbi:MAG: DUF2306 domain-containing protein [Myxococcaceae bacterium]|nr:DUF2306 domain-containing protein [Myxococcaceae bacterium]